jgi:hemerythrin-like domain-containing protein
MTSVFDRRGIVRLTTGLMIAGSTLAPPAPSRALAQGREKDRESQEHNGEGGQGKTMPGVTPPEDLMREHGVLNRVLLIYETSIRKLSGSEDFDPSVIGQGAGIIRRFIHNYHERNEEQQLFPRFRRAGQMVNLVDILYQQHQGGRRLTDTIIDLVPKSRSAGDDRASLVRSMQAFVTMYRPHEAREDTELFPKLRSVVSANEFDAMAEDFEKDEHQKFGDDGFETMVRRVADLEKKLGINNLAQFTPR